MGVPKPTVAPAAHCASAKPALGRRNYCATALRCASVPRALVRRNCHFWHGSSHFALPGLTTQSLPWTLLCWCDACREHSLVGTTPWTNGSQCFCANKSALFLHKQVSSISPKAKFLWTTHCTQIFSKSCSLHKRNQQQCQTTTVTLATVTSLKFGLKVH